MTKGPVAALLRGVNVAGRSPISMAKLRSDLSDAGLTDVGTYLQSGNLIVPPSSRSPGEVASAIERVIADSFGKEIRVIVRTREQMAEILTRNPFLDSGTKPALLHVVLLRSKPHQPRIGDLDPGRSPSDRFSVSGREVFVEYPGGSGRSKLNLAYFEKVLGVTGTARNWNTVSKLSELLAG